MSFLLSPFPLLFFRLLAQLSLSVFIWRWILLLPSFDWYLSVPWGYLGGILMESTMLCRSCIRHFGTRWCDSCSAVALRLDLLLYSHNLFLILLVIFVPVILLVRSFLFLGILPVIFILGLPTIFRALLRLLSFQDLFHFLRILRVKLVNVSRFSPPYLAVLLSYRFNRDIISIVVLQFLIFLQRFASAVLICWGLSIKFLRGRCCLPYLFDFTRAAVPAFTASYRPSADPAELSCHRVWPALETPSEQAVSDYHRYCDYY